MKKSAGILAFRRSRGELEVLLAHPGGPYWAKKDLGAWMIPKGEFTDEEPLAAARREFEEEIGQPIEGTFMALPVIRHRSGKQVHAFAIEADLDVTNIKSNLVEIEWPPKSGRKRSFPEIDRAEWFDLGEARQRILPSEAPLIDELVSLLKRGVQG